MHSTLGALCCAVACAHPLSQVSSSSACPLTRLLRITLLAGPVLGIEVHGRDAEVQALEVDAAGHTHTSTLTRGRKANPPDAAVPKKVDALANGPLGQFGESTGEVATDDASTGPDPRADPNIKYTGNMGLNQTVALIIFMAVCGVLVAILVIQANYMGAGCIVWVAVGVLGLMLMENWTLLTSAYVMTQIITTIGYGDIGIEHPVMKVFVGFYVVGTLLLIGTVVTDLMDRLMKPGKEVLGAKLKTVQNAKAGEAAPPPPAMDANTAALLNSFLQFMSFVVIGTVFFALYEPCVCGFDWDVIEGCVEDKCSETGGISKSWLDAFNMSLITLTTVGFGDQTPMSALGRFLGMFWMLAGVGVTGSFCGAFGGLILANDKEAKRLSSVSHELFNKIDKNSDGTLSRIEFRSYALVKFGLVEEDDLDMIDDLFNTIDDDGSGQLTFEEIMHHCDN